MLERKLTDLGDGVPPALCGLDVEGVPGTMHSLLRVAAMLANAPQERTEAAVEQEAEQLAGEDPAAAERALSVLRRVCEHLARARSEARMALLLGDALVRAADALPEQFEVGRG
jgi:hypothetical protein